jgi:hypothetical protein
MKGIARSLTLAFGAGCIGALANSLAVWLLGTYGITQGFGVRIAPSLTTGWLYPRLVWGGIWGFLLLFPILRSRAFARGLLISLGPTLVQLFVVFPRAGQGLMGLSLGNLTPIAVLVFNAVWGVAASSWFRWVR